MTPRHDHHADPKTDYQIRLDYNVSANSGFLSNLTQNAQESPAVNGRLWAKSLAAPPLKPAKPQIPPEFTPKQVVSGPSAAHLQLPSPCSCHDCRRLCFAHY